MTGHMAGGAARQSNELHRTDEELMTVAQTGSYGCNSNNNDRLISVFSKMESIYKAIGDRVRMRTYSKAILAITKSPPVTSGKQVIHLKELEIHLQKDRPV
jgi:hypothetical protein